MTPRKAKAKRSAARAVTDVDILIGERIRAARLKAHMSQDQLGQLLGVSFQQVQKYEKGWNRVGIARMMVLAKALNTPLDYFTGVSETKRTNGGAAFDSFLATREGVQIIEAMMKLEPPHRQSLIALAKSLAAE